VIVFDIEDPNGALVLPAEMANISPYEFSLEETDATADGSTQWRVRPAV
jgi:hypothetical protein